MTGALFTPGGSRYGHNPLPVAPLVDADLVCRKVLVRDKDVVFVKGVFEASEGVGSLFAERGGELIISAPLSRERELDELLTDLQSELHALVTPIVP
jgi:hypothetical protein